MLNARVVHAKHTHPHTHVLTHHGPAAGLSCSGWVAPEAPRGSPSWRPHQILPSVQNTNTHIHIECVYTHCSQTLSECGRDGGGRERTQRRRGDWKLCNGASASTLQIHNALCIVEKLLKGKEEPRLWIPCPSFWQSKNLGEEEALPVRSDIVKQTTSPPPQP